MCVCYVCVCAYVCVLVYVCMCVLASLFLLPLYYSRISGGRQSPIPFIETLGWTRNPDRGISGGAACKSNKPVYHIIYPLLCAVFNSVYLYDAVFFLLFSLSPFPLIISLLLLSQCRRRSISYVLSSPDPGTYIISMHYKGN